jgi:di/tricarboxylate transporter
MRDKIMEKHERKSSIAWGVILVLLGLVFLAYQFNQDLFNQWFGNQFPWPLFIIVPGLVMLVTGLITTTGGLVIPGSIVTGVGSLLYYQNLTGDWESWAYAWTLMPGFVGLGLLLASLVEPSAHRAERKTGAYMFAISLSVFAIFAALFNNNINMQLVWPVVLIVVGVAFLAGSFLDRK